MSSTLIRRIPRPTPAMLVAFAALFAALGGTGYAAVKITGKDIAKGTLTGKHIDDGSLKGKELAPDSIGGKRIDEAKLGTVPSAQHAATADSAASADNAAKAGDADKLDGIDSAGLLKNETRWYETNADQNVDLGNNEVLASLNLSPGVYLVTAKVPYSNDGATDPESCRLNIPTGDDDVTNFVAEASATTVVMLQEYMTSHGTVVSVSCTSDGDDDMPGILSIVATRMN